MGVLLCQSDATAIPLADQSVDLVFGSCPYGDARTYNRLVSGGDEECKHRKTTPIPGRHWQYHTCNSCGGMLEHIDGQRGCVPWIEWMLTVVAECCRVSRGLVLINCAGVTRKWRYQPGPEGLLWEWWKRGGECWRPAYWHRVGIPGSGGKQWLRADIEYVLAFKAKPGPIPWSDNTANGHPPKWGPGGEMSNRTTGGCRVNRWGHGGDGPTCKSRLADGTIGTGIRPSQFVSPLKDYQTVWGNRPSKAGKRPDGSPNGNYFNGAWSRQHTKSRADGSDEVQTYNVPILANPGNLVSITVGGGHLGSTIAHENEAPFPEALAEWFIKTACPPGGLVCDPFSGSGTTPKVAHRLGRRAIGFDLRMSQCQLGLRRMAEPENAPKRKREPRAVVSSSLPTLFDLGAA